MSALPFLIAIEILFHNMQANNKTPTQRTMISCVLVDFAYLLIKYNDITLITIKIAKKVKCYQPNICGFIFFSFNANYNFSRKQYKYQTSAKKFYYNNKKIV